MSFLIVSTWRKNKLIYSVFFQQGQGTNFVSTLDACLTLLSGWQVAGCVNVGNLITCRVDTEKLLDDENLEGFGPYFEVRLHMITYKLTVAFNNFLAKTTF